MEKLIESFVFFDSTSTTADSNTFSCGKGGNYMAVQVTGNAGSIALTFKGKVDYNATDFVNIAAINISTLSKVTQITANGVYIVPLVGVCQVKANCTSGVGSVKVLGDLLG